MNPIIEIKSRLKIFELEKLFFTTFKEGDQTSFRVLYLASEGSDQIVRRAYKDAINGLDVVEFYPEVLLDPNNPQEYNYGNDGYNLKKLIPFKEVALMYGIEIKDKYSQKEIKDLNAQFNNSHNVERTFQYTKKNQD